MTNSDNNTPVQLTPEAFYKQCTSYMEEVGRKVEGGGNFDITIGRRLVLEILQNPEGFLEDLHHLTLLQAGVAKQALATHAVNVMIAALILGRKLGYTEGELESLGIAALFHKIGMYFIPKPVRNKEGELSREELTLVRRHPLLASEELRKYGAEYQHVADIVLQEYERIDGSGYPYGLEGEQIYEKALVIGLLDIYEALVCHTPYRQKIAPSEAMKAIVRRSKGLFPSRIIKKLLLQLSLYPVKSYVRLNNGSVGVVLKTNTLWPLKPIVQIISDAQGRRVLENEKIIDLSKTPLWYIKSVISAEDVEGYGQGDSELE